MPTDSTFKASASELEVEKEILVFLCYRDEDGKSHADWINRALNGWECTRHDGSKALVRTYFAGTAPAVADWTKYHFPSLQSAKSLIVICTPGAARDFSVPGRPDWLYEELRWWIANRSHPPIVVDVTSDGARWIPEPILQKWPNINRVPLRLTEAQSLSGTIDQPYLERWRQQIENTLQESERATTFETVAKLLALNAEQKSLNAKLKRRARVLAVAFAVVAVLASIASWLFVEASRANDTSRALNRFLGGLFYQADPEHTRGASLTAGELLDAGVSQASRSPPAVRIDMLSAIGAAYTGLGESDKAIALLDDAVKLAQQHSISKQTQLNLALAYGETLLYRERFDDAREPLERALELSRDATDRSRALVALGDLETYAPKGNLTLADRRYQQAIDIDRQLEDRLSEAREENRLGYLAEKKEDHRAAKQHYSAASSLARQAGETSGSVLIAKYDHDRAALQYEDGDLRGALESFELARQQLAKVYGEDSPDVAIADNNIARLMIETNVDLTVAEQRLAHTVATLEAKRGPDYADLSKTANSLGLLLRERGERADARNNFERARTIAETNDDHRIAAQALVHLAEMHMADGKLAAAKVELDRALLHYPDAESRQGWRFGLYQGALAELQIANCQLQEASKLLDESDRALSERWGWQNIFRRANEQRRAELTTLQNNDTARCRGAAPYVPAEKS